MSKESKSPYLRDSQKESPRLTPRTPSPRTPPRKLTRKESGKKRQLHGDCWLYASSTLTANHLLRFDTNEIIEFPNYKRLFEGYTPEYGFPHECEEDLTFENFRSFVNRENLIRTTISMLLIRGYLESKNIDYIMFEGISTISDNLTVNKPKNANVYYGFDKLIDKNFSSQVLEDKTFFNKYGPMQPFNRTHPLYDVDINLGHPNSEFVKWWADEMYNHIKDNQ